MMLIRFSISTLQFKRTINSVGRLMSDRLLTEFFHWNNTQLESLQEKESVLRVFRV